LKLASLALVCLLFGAAARADAPLELRGTDAPEMDAIAARHDADIPAGFGSDVDAFVAWLALEDDKPIAARERAAARLTREPTSFAAHCLLARVLRRAEGDPARALHHAARCRALFEKNHTREPSRAAPWFWHQLALMESYAASESLGHHAESLEYLDALEAYHPGDIDALRGWPLMSLGRLDEARAAARRAIERNRNATQVAKAYTALCALEARAGRAEAAHEACRAALQRGRNPDDLGARLVNLAESVRSLGRTDEVERLLLRATEHFSSRTLASPWLELMKLYLEQGRFAEALNAAREARSWRLRQPPALDVHTRAAHERASALLLLAFGRSLAASQLTSRALARPDRASEISVDAEELALAAALMERAACLSAAETLRERLSFAAPIEAARAAWLWLEMRLRAWRATRIAATHLRPAALAARIAPHAASEIEIPEWIEPDLVAIVGSEIMERALEAAARDPGDGYAHAYFAETELQRGQPVRALAHVRSALRHLPRAEALLRARVAALGVRAAGATDDVETAARLAAEALALDPGALRRARARLPVRMPTSMDAVSQRASRLLQRSPRFVETPSPLRLSLSSSAGGASACLHDLAAELHCSEIEREAGEPDAALARRLVATLHETLFAPAPTGGSSDLSSLDGATAVTSARGRARLDRLIDELQSPASGG
jgi:tetratricopeptide (TPR) repeat protein